MSTKHLSLPLLLSLAAVYVLWGSSFMFTKMAGNHFPVPAFQAVRFLTAGTLLMTVARFVNGSAWPSRPLDWRYALSVGFFMVFCSNGLNGWAIHYLPTNQVALLNGTAAFWIAGLGTLGPRGHPLSRRALLGLAVGFLGTVLVLIPRGPLHPTHALAQLGVLGAGLAFSVGTLYYRNIETEVPPVMFMAMQLLCGGTLLLLLALVRGDFAAWDWNSQGMLALGYLTFFSSSLAFTAYGWLTRNSTPTIIGTYSYVNPAIAAYMGWQFLHESLSSMQLTGMAVVMIGVGILTLPGSSVSEPKTLEEPKVQ